MIKVEKVSSPRRETPSHHGWGPEEASFLDSLARELATETCPRCSTPAGWKTAAMMHEGLELKYYYCYQCRRWSTRHFRYRYAVAPLDDLQVIEVLVKQLEALRVYAPRQEKISWFQRRLRSAGSYFHRYMPF